MVEPVTITIGQVIAAFLGICGAVVTISAAAAAVWRWITAAKKPQVEQNERITSLEERVARHDELLANDKKRLEAVEEGNRVTQRALLALLDHGIDGNNIEQMKQAKDDLQRHLIER